MAVRHKAIVVQDLSSVMDDGLMITRWPAWQVAKKGSDFPRQLGGADERGFSTWPAPLVDWNQDTATAWSAVLGGGEFRDNDNGYFEFSGRFFPSRLTGSHRRRVGQRDENIPGEH